jgi:hypothetical protein
MYSTAVLLLLKLTMSFEIIEFVNVGNCDLFLGWTPLPVEFSSHATSPVSKPEVNLLHCKQIPHWCDGYAVVRVSYASVIRLKHRNLREIFFPPLRPAPMAKIRIRNVLFKQLPLFRVVIGVSMRQSPGSNAYVIRETGHDSESLLGNQSLLLSKFLPASLAAKY